MVQTFTAVFGHFQTTNQSLNLFYTQLVNKLQKTLKQTRWFLESLRISYGHENKLANYYVANTEYLFPI